MVEYWLVTIFLSSQYSTITIFLKPILYHYNISQANTLPLQYFSSQYSTITIFLKPILYHYNISQTKSIPGSETKHMIDKQTYKYS
jgi:hypothetical protein